MHVHTIDFRLVDQQNQMHKYHVFESSQLKSAAYNSNLLITLVTIDSIGYFHARDILYFVLHGKPT